MKILMISSGYYPDSCGGVETITQILAEGIHKKKHNVSVLYCKEEIVKDEVYYHNGIKVIKFKPCICRKNRKITPKINRYLQMYNYFNKSKLREIVREEKPDIIHIHMPRIISYAIYKVAVEEHIPTIATLHEYYSLWNYNPFLSMGFMTNSKPPFICKIFRYFQKSATQEIDYVISPFYEVIEKYQGEGYFKFARAIEIQNALCIQNKNILQEIEIKKKRLEEKRTRSFLLIGRLIQFKGIEESLEAFYRWNMENVELLIAGEGPLKLLVEDYCKKDSRIKYFGFVKGVEKQKLYRQADVLLFLVSEIETFGLVCLEGYSYGLPVITSDTDAMKRIVNDKKTGKVIKYINLESIQQAMESYVGYYNWKYQIDECVKKLAEYDYNTFIKKHLSIYDKFDVKEM